MADEYSFIERYKPTTLGRIIGHRDAIAKITKWIDEYDTVKKFLMQHNLLKKSLKGRKKNVVDITEIECEYRKSFGTLIISGPNGCGKTSIINLIAKNLKCELINLNQIEHIEGEIDSNFIFKVNATNENNKRNIIIVDDYDSIISTQSKLAITNMVKENNYLRLIPIIIITNDVHNRNATGIEKYSNKIDLYAPYLVEINKWINKICYDNSMNFAEGVSQRFIEYFDKDIRKILTQLWEIYLIYKNTTITNDLFDKYILTMAHTTQNVNLFKSTAKILSEGFDMKFCLEKYEVDKIVLPLMIYQNYPKFVNNKHHEKIINNISSGDIFEYYIHCEQNWELTEINGITYCAIPSYNANLYGNGNINQTLRFAMDLNKTSFKRKNKKKIIAKNNIVDNNSSCYIRNKTIDEFIYINDIEE